MKMFYAILLLSILYSKAFIVFLLLKFIFACPFQIEHINFYSHEDQTFIKNSTQNTAKNDKPQPSIKTLHNSSKARGAARWSRSLHVVHLANPDPPCDSFETDRSAFSILGASQWTRRRRTSRSDLQLLPDLE